MRRNGRNRVGTLILMLGVLGISVPSWAGTEVVRMSSLALKVAQEIAADPATLTRLTAGVLSSSRPALVNGLSQESPKMRVKEVFYYLSTRRELPLPTIQYYLAGLRPSSILMMARDLGMIPASAKLSREDRYRLIWEMRSDRTKGRLVSAHWLGPVIPVRDGFPQIRALRSLSHGAYPWDVSVRDLIIASHIVTPNLLCDVRAVRREDLQALPAILQQLYLDKPLIQAEPYISNDDGGRLAQRLTAQSSELFDELSAVARQDLLEILVDRWAARSLDKTLLLSVGDLERMLSETSSDELKRGVILFNIHVLRELVAPHGMHSRSDGFIPRLDFFPSDGVAANLINLTAFLGAQARALGIAQGGRAPIFAIAGDDASMLSPRTRSRLGSPQPAKELEELRTFAGALPLHAGGER